MKAPTISKRIWLVISTVAVIGGFFAFYFFVYMENRKIDLEAKKFRMLEQYAENIKNAYEEHTKKLKQKGTPNCIVPDTMKCIPVDMFDFVRVDTITGIDRDRLSRLRNSKLKCVPFTILRPLLDTLSAKDLALLEKIFLDSVKCLEPDLFKQARADVTAPIVKQSDFSELLFEVDSIIETQTFKNSIDTSIVNTILRKDNASIKREVEFNVNNKNYIIFIHSFELEGKPWRILGFCSKEEFNSQVRSVDLVYVFSATLLLILILLMMPLLKLWIMNELEKLQTVNVWFCGFSLVVGSAFLLLIILMANDLFTSYESFSAADLKRNRNKRIEVLCDTIEERFIAELKQIHKQIQESKDYNCTNRFYDSISKYGEIQNDTLFIFSSYPYFNEMLWIDEDGNQNFVVSTHSQDSSDVVNLGGRTYFSHALNKETSWMLPDQDTTSERFALQSIHSYLTSLHEAGFGVRINSGDLNTRVLAVATKLHSIMDPLLPPGYQFVMIDKTGKVWFHSTIQKNLNENLFDETGRDRKLIAAVEGRVSARITVNYNRAIHQGFVKPIRSTELFLVVLHDEEYFNTPIVLTVGFASMLVFILLAVQGVHQLVLLISTNKFSLLKIRRFFLTWLRPQMERKTIYRDAVFVQLILLFLAANLARFTHSLNLVVCFLSLPVFLTMFHYFSLKRSYIVKDGKRQSRKIFTHPFFLASVLLAMFINFSGVYFFYKGEFVKPLIIQLVFVAILIVFFRIKDLDSINDLEQGERVGQILWKKVLATVAKSQLFGQFFHPRATEAQMNANQPVQPLWKKGLSPKVKNVSARLNEFRNVYHTFLFLWLILASIVPTYYFYKVGYYEEGKIWMRFIQHEAAQRQELRDLSLQKELAPKFEKYLDKIKKVGNYLDITHEIRLDDSGKFNAIGESPFHRLMFKNAPALKGLAEQSRAVLFPASADRQWVSYEDGLNNRLEYVSRNGEHRNYQSELLTYKTLKGDYWLILLIVFTLGIIVLYRTLRFCIIHIFGLSLLHEPHFQTPKLTPGGKERYFIVGLPCSGKRKLVELIRKGIVDDKVLHIDLNEGTFIRPGKSYQLIVARNFHMDLNNHDSNEKKLELIESFKNHEGAAVIIVSNVDPSAILEFYEKVARYYRNDKKDYELQGNYRICRQAFRKWKQLLGNYSIHYHALKKEEPFADNKFISHELDHGEYLPKLKEQLKESISNRREREEMILKVENLSHFYYTLIWNCLTSSEKFLLHDLAKDGFVNMRNMKIIRALRQKGILTARNSLRIMNRSFNNFILSVVEEDADIRVEEEMRKKGSWNTLHLVLVITIISIIVFLGIAQQELFKNFQAIIAFTTALLPLLARFGGIFTGSKSKE